MSAAPPQRAGCRLEASRRCRRSCRLYWSSGGGASWPELLLVRTLEAPSGTLVSVKRCCGGGVRLRLRIFMRLRWICTPRCQAQPKLHRSMAISVHSTPLQRLDACWNERLLHAASVAALSRISDSYFLLPHRHKSTAIA